MHSGRQIVPSSHWPKWIIGIIIRGRFSYFSVYFHFPFRSPKFEFHFDAWHFSMESRQPENGPSVRNTFSSDVTSSFLSTKFEMEIEAGFDHCCERIWLPHQACKKSKHFYFPIRNLLKFFLGRCCNKVSTVPPTSFLQLPLYWFMQIKVMINLILYWAAIFSKLWKEIAKLWSNLNGECVE